MNPFDLTGPEFLKLYVPTCLFATLVAAVLRYLLRTPSGESQVNLQLLDPYEVAYLAGGPSGLAHAALAALVHKEVVEVDGTNLRTKKPPPLKPHAVEAAVLSGLGNSEILSVPQAMLTIRRNLQTVTEKYRDRLSSMGLVPEAGAANIARFLPFLIMAAVAGFGGIKIAVGLARGRNVGILVVLCGFASLIAVFFLKPVLRSRKGDALLRNFKSDNEALKTTAISNGESLTPADLILAVGLFGAAAMAFGPLANLKKAMMPPIEAGSGCSAGSWGSSCSGGGGCGGGGCGGGGCGGCGS